MLKRLIRLGLDPTYTLQMRARPCRFVFLVGHMRSASSLLTHILLTNPEITGVGETHIRYDGPDDLRRLVLRIFPQTRRLRLTRYALDKVIHENRLASDDLLHRADCSFVYFLREPVGTIRSLERALPEWWRDEGRAGPFDPATVHAEATNHYRQRLRSVEREAAVVGDQGRAAFLTHDQLIHRTRDAFGMLERFLGLQHPLTEQYELTPWTGSGGYGDTSPHIKKGRLDRAIRHDEPAHHPPIPDDLPTLYEHVAARLAAMCMSLATPPTNPGLVEQRGAARGG